MLKEVKQSRALDAHLHWMKASERTEVILLRRGQYSTGTDLDVLR